MSVNPNPLRTLLFGTVGATGRLVRVATNAAGHFVMSLAPGSFINVGINNVEFDGGQAAASGQTLRVAVADDDTNLAPVASTVETDRLAVNPIVGQVGVAADHGVSTAATPRMAANIIDDQNGVTGNAGNVGAATQRTVEATDSVLNAAVASVKAVAGAAAASVGQQLGLYASSGEPAAVDEGDLVRAVATLSGYLKMAGYEDAANIQRVVRQNPDNEKAVPDQWEDTDLAAAAHYYPSSSGFSMEGFADVSVQGAITDCVLTIEATGDPDAGSATWVDVTKTFELLSLGTTGHASIDATGVAKDDILHAERLNVARVRFVVTCPNVTNIMKLDVRRMVG